MDRITIKKPVTIKVKVTENYKKNVAAEIQQYLQKVEADLNHLEFQSKRMIVELEKQNPHGIPQARQHLDKQGKKLAETREQLMEKLHEIERLPVGSEIMHGTIESISEIKVGDNWSDILGVEILVQDEKIIEIRGKG